MAFAISPTINRLKERARVSPIGRFWAWWTGELKDVIPDSVRERLVAPTARVFVQTTEDGLLVQAGGAASEPLLIHPEQDQELAAQQVTELLRDSNIEEPEVVLLLSGSRALRRQVQMPLAAEKELKQAIHYDLDRQTPFSADEVLYDYNVLERRPDANVIDVELIVIPKNGLEERLQQLKSTGLGIHRVDIGRIDSDEEAQGLNLLPFELRAQRPNRRARFHWLLGTVAVALLAVVMWQSLKLREQASTELDEAVTEARQQAMLVRNMQTELDDAEEAARFLADLKNKREPVIGLLEEITRVIPDDTYLQRLIINDCELQLQGLSNSAQQLIQLVNESDQFTNASFRGPIATDPRSGRERFSLIANIACKV